MMKIQSIILSLLFILNIGIAANSNASNKSTLKLKSGNYELVPNISTIGWSDLASAKLENQYYVLIHFKEIPTNKVKLQLTKLGITLKDYLPENSFLATINEGINLMQLNAFSIDGVFLISPQFKMSYEVYMENYPEYARAGDMVKLVVQHYAKDDFNMDVIYQQLGARVLSKYAFSNLTSIQIPISKVSKLAAFPLVKYMEVIAPDPEPEDVRGQSNHRMNYISNSAINTIPFNGEGVWLAVGDDGAMGPHIDYAGRMDLSSVGPSTGTHGDHVSGIMMGAGNVDPEARGMAWGADIKVYDVWDAVNSTPTSYYNPGVVVTSTSYGNGCNAGYTSFAQTADQQVRTMPNLMHVFSAGNSGTSNCGYGAGSGWGNITGGIKAGKNVLAVGNVTETDQLSSSSSRGPASDGRIKPDICANGTQVYSCDPNNQYAYKSGTSMAAPGVSGAYGALVHAYRIISGGGTPPSALVKGAMLNTADDLGNIGPDFKFGWGRLNARRVVQVFENNTYQLDSISQSGVNQHMITVPSGVQQLKVMVYWNDYEGSTSTSQALVNNIDMTITDPSSSTLFPYILDHTPNPTNLNTPATNGVDSINNMEQVVVNTPTAGNFTVNITGTLIPQGPQKYYVIYEFITDEIVVTYPTGGEGFEPGSEELIRWDAPVGTQNFQVEYSTDNGGNWNTLSTAGVNQRFASFVVPSVVTGEALVRVTRNGVSGQSQLPFSIIGVPQNIEVITSCPSSFDLKWDPVTGATHYEVSVLGSKYMDSVITVTDTNATLNGFSANDAHWVSVKAKTSNAIGKRAIAIEKQPGVWNCILNEDIGLELVSPSTVIPSCISLPNSQVVVKLKNNGLQSVTNVELNMVYNGGNVVTETFNGSILPGDSNTFTFSQTINIPSFASSNPLLIWKSLPDDNILNDSINTILVVYESTSSMLPYSTDFQDQTTCSTANDCGLTVCGLTGWKNVENGVIDDIDFRVNVGDTPSSGTGPNAGHTDGGSFDKYLYLEASGSCEFMTAELYSPCFDLSNTITPVASVWYHMNGTEMGELHFDVYVNNEWSLDFIPALSGNKGNTWYEAVMDLTPYTGASNAVIRIRATTGSSFRSDLAIDDFEIKDTSSVGIEDNTGMDNISMNIYPNPTSGKFEVEITGAVESSDLMVYDVKGMTVFTHLIKKSSHGIKEQLDLSHLGRGVYILRIQSSNSSRFTKLIIQ